MEKNPLLTVSELPFGAPKFDEIQLEHYLPAFRQALDEAKAEVDAIVTNPEPPSFENTIEALEYSGETLDRVASIFFNLLEADSDDEMQKIAEEVSPLMNDFQMYVSLNEALFARIKAVHDAAPALPRDAEKLLDDMYTSFSRGGANLCPEDKKKYAAMQEELSLLELRYGKNVLDATNAYTLHIEDESRLAGLPDYVRETAAEAAKAKELEGWLFDLTAPSFRPFMKYADDRQLREQMYMAYNTRALSGEGDNRPVVSRIVELRIAIANILGYETYADFVLERRMAKSVAKVDSFLQELLEPSLPAAHREIQEVLDFAKDNGFEGERIEPWDFSYWSEKYRDSRYAFNDGLLKPYFSLDACIDAVFGLARTLYGLQFTERTDLPVYHKDVKVYDVTDGNGRHMALFYADFFPRASKRGGAWMTEFRGQSIKDGAEQRPFISIVTNFSKPTATAPSLLTHDELTTFLHEFGHSLHGMLAEGRYGSQTGTNVTRDFVELPSQIMENWAFEPEYLNSFAKHYKTGETIPEELITRLVAAQNFQSGYFQVRQLQFGILDMAWHSLKAIPEDLDVVAFEKAALLSSNVLPSVPECSISASFNHIFSGGYSAGYYSYKWAEVLEADAFSLFKEKGIFSQEVASSFRENILSRGSTEEADVIYRNFRGHDPETKALLIKLGIISSNSLYN